MEIRTGQKMARIKQQLDKKNKIGAENENEQRSHIKSERQQRNELTKILWHQLSIINRDRVDRIEYTYKHMSMQNKRMSDETDSLTEWIRTSQ